MIRVLHRGVKARQASLLIAFAIRSGVYFSGDGPKSKDTPDKRLGNP